MMSGLMLSCAHRTIGFLSPKTKHTHKHTSPPSPLPKQIQTITTHTQVLTAECWAKAGLDSNPATQPQPLASGARLTRTYDGAADPNKGGK